MTDLMYIKGNCFVFKLSAKIGESYYFSGIERVEKNGLLKGEVW